MCQDRFVRLGDFSPVVSLLRTSRLTRAEPKRDIDLSCINGAF